jgi:signal transduction histidine kinase
VFDPKNEVLMQPSPPSSVQNPARLAALHATDLLDSPPEPAFDRLTRLATAVLHVPIALVSLVDEDRQFFKSCIGVAEPWASLRETPLSHSFCQHAVAAKQPLIIDDTRSHPLVYDNPAITQLDVAAYAGIPLITPEGHALGTLCVVDTQPRHWTETEVNILRELAASVMTEIALRRQTEAAEQALEARDELLAIIAHDLRNPVSVIHAYIQLLRPRVPPRGPADIEQLSTGLEHMGSATTRLAAQIDELLDLARLQAGEALELQLRTTDLVALARQVALEQQQTTRHHAIAVVTSLPELCGCYDPVRIARVLSNLLSNAVKYSPNGGAVTVEVSRERDAAGAWAVLRVRDEGLGIPEAEIPRIFDRFRRASNVVGRIAGTGIGLASVQQIVAAHQGTIAVASREGLGTTVAVRLPLPAAPNREQPA